MFNKTFQYVKRIFYILLFLPVFYSCDEEIKPINFETSSIDKTFEADITVMFDKAINNNDTGENINSNIEKYCRCVWGFAQLLLEDKAALSRTPQAADGNQGGDAMSES